MSTTTPPFNPPRKNTAPEPHVLPPSEPNDFGPIIELGPIEPNTVEHNIPQAGAIQTTADFNPTPTLADQILEDAANPNLPLLTIAQNAGVTLNTLRLWLARPEISEQLDAIESTLRRRARLKVLHELDNITEACATILERFHRAPDRGSTEDRRPDTELRASAIITRNASNALMASRVMLALARYLDGPPRAQRQRTEPSAGPTPACAPSPSENHTKTLRLLPALADVGLHDFREYLTSNRPHNGHTVEDLTVPPVRRCSERQPVPTTNDSSNPPTPVPPVRRGPPRQPAPTTSNAATTTSAVATHPRPTKPDKSYPSHRSASSYPPPPSANLCTCGPTPCSACPSAPTLLTIAGTRSPRARDPTAPR